MTLKSNEVPKVDMQFAGQAYITNYAVRVYFVISILEKSILTENYVMQLKITAVKKMIVVISCHAESKACSSALEIDKN